MRHAIIVITAALVAVFAAAAPANERGYSQAELDQMLAPVALYPDSVLSNILIEADPDGVRLSGTDLDIAVSLRVPAEVEESGALTVPAKKLQELARELPELPAKVSAKGERLELRCGRAVFRINGMTAEEFPAFPKVDFGRFGRSWTGGARGRRLC
jgi:hypothetical protein